MMLGNEENIQEYFLTPGNVLVFKKEALISTALGSAVAVCLHDKHFKYGGMVNFLYSKSSILRSANNEYGDIALASLLSMMVDLGCKIKNLQAHIVGGAELSSFNPSSTGEKNIKIARKMLKKHDILLMSEDVGGFKGRKVIFNTSTNELLILKTHRIRRGDFYPYRLRIEN